MILAQLVTFSTLLVFVLTDNIDASRSCNKPGVITNGKEKTFQICSKNSDGQLTLKHLSCGDGSYFDTKSKRCISTSPNKKEDEPSKPTRFKGAAPGRPSISKRLYDINNDCPMTAEKFCDSCQNLVTCFHRKVTTVTSCREGKTCDPYRNQCTNETILECQNGQNDFVCNAMGLFPDPYFCNRYHFCSQADSNPLTYNCSYYKKYDPGTEECSNSDSRIFSNDTPCPIFDKCNEDLQVGALSSNPNIYFACIEVSPKVFKRMLFRCDGNSIFNGSECSNNE